MTRGKVVLVAFPFDDFTADKARPAVCLTHPIGVHRHVVLAFVTSRQPDDVLDTDIVVDPSAADFVQTGSACGP
jgi:mRNA interferase MazF